MPATRKRVSKRYEVIADALQARHRFLSAQELYGVVRAGGEAVGLATVYRTLQAMADDGLVDVVRSPSGEALYRQCDSARHHHHLICRVCGRTVEVVGPAVERWAAKVGAEHDFDDIEHTVEIVGTCSDCRPSTGRVQRE